MAGLNPEGIDRLEKVMLANGKYFYDQKQFGYTDDCGTHLCAAGFCRLLTIGEKALASEKGMFFRKAQDRHSLPDEMIALWQTFADNCISDGKRILGVSTEDTTLPDIFDLPSYWPYDLARGFEELQDDASTTPADLIKFYINMLRTRANSDGSLTPHPETELY